jgi:hypothetical protein
MGGKAGSKVVLPFFLEIFILYEAAGIFKVSKFIVMRMLYSILTGSFRFARLARFVLFSC